MAICMLLLSWRRLEGEIGWTWYRCQGDTNRSVSGSTDGTVVGGGTLERFKRSEAQKLIEAQGGVCQSSVTQKTTLVIAGSDAGSKLEKAKKLGIRVIDEATFAAMLEK